MKACRRGNKKEKKYFHHPKINSYFNIIRWPICDFVITTIHHILSTSFFVPMCMYCVADVLVPVFIYRSCQKIMRTIQCVWQSVISAANERDIENSFPPFHQVNVDFQNRSLYSVRMKKKQAKTTAMLKIDIFILLQITMQCCRCHLNSYN